MLQKNYLSQYLAECIGTFFLVFFGTGAIILNQKGLGDVNGPTIALVFGAVVTIMIYGTGHISGAHFNPAVTIAFWFIGRFPKEKLFGQIISQFLGAILATSIHFLIWGKSVTNYGVTSFSVPLPIGMLLEFILSFVLMFIITSVATDSRAVGELAGIAIGLTVFLCAAVGGPLTGASMNPARSFSPALFCQALIHYWPYLFAPIFGAMAGAKTYELVKCFKIDKVESDETHGCC